MTEKSAKTQKHQQPWQYEIKSKSVCVLKAHSESFFNDYNIVKKINKGTIMDNKALNVIPHKPDFDNYVYLLYI